jgi:hypothetical protein
MFRCSLPSTGSLGSVPPLHWYYEALRLPAALRASLRFLRFALPSCALSFAPRGARRSAHGPGVIYRIPQTGFIDGDDRISQVPGGPRYERAVLSDPGGTAALGHCRASMSPSARLTASAPARSIISRLNHTARPFAVYASQGGLPHRHARLASGWLANLSGRDWLPAGSQRKVSGHPILLSQASPGALILYAKNGFTNRFSPSSLAELVRVDRIRRKCGSYGAI